MCKDGWRAKLELSNKSGSETRMCDVAMTV